MSYKITNAKFLDQKIEVDDFNFTTDGRIVTQVLLSNPREKKTLTRILKGKEQIEKGRFLVDNLDLVNPRFVKNRAVFIHTDKYIERFVSARLILVLSTLFNPKFFRNARITHLRTKYDYLSYVSSKNNLTDYRLKTKLDKTISKFINEEMKAEYRVLEEFEKQLTDFNIKKSNDIFGEHNSILKVVARSYYKERLKLETYNLTLTFLQALWDNVYKFDSLRNSCTCEYNTKRSSNKELKKAWKELNYHQTEYVVKKQLKYLAIRITEHRTLIRRQKKLVNQLKKQLHIELKKIYSKTTSSKETVANFEKQLSNWKKLNNDQIDLFITSQHNYFFNILAHNAQYVAKILVVEIHRYHQQVLNQSLKYGSKEEFQKKRKFYKNQIVSIFKQSLNYNQNLLTKFGISLDWFFKSTFKLSSLNILFVKIVRAINLNHHNIFLMDFMHLLSPSDFEKFIKTLEIIKRNSPETSFILLDSHANRFPFLDEHIYKLNKKLFNKDYLENIVTADPNKCRDTIFNNRNLFRYEYDGEQIKLYNRREVFIKPNLAPKGYAFINPFKMHYEGSTDFDQSRIVVISGIKKTNNFNDPYMYYCKNEKGYKFYFYDYEKNDLESVSRAIITFDLGSIAEFI